MKNGAASVPGSVISVPQVFRPHGNSRSWVPLSSWFQAEETEAWGGLTTCPGYSARDSRAQVLFMTQSSSEAKDISGLSIFLCHKKYSVPRRTSRQEKRLRKPWRVGEMTVFWRMSQLQTVRAGSAVKLLETGTSCVSSTLPPLTVFCCLYYVLRVSNIYILSCYHNSPSCFTLILYLREFRTYRSPCLSLSEYFILTCSWVAWISLSSNSLKKGSCVLYSLCFFFFSYYLSLSFFLFEQQLGWI